MTAYIVDTNVPIVANENSQQASPECVTACIEMLETVVENTTSIDDGMLVLTEYMNNLSLAGQPGAGDFFMKWIHENQAVNDRVERVSITPTNTDSPSFEEFPDDPDLANFDLSDRKFVAVARESELDPVVLNAVDSDWWDDRIALKNNGVQVQFLCPEQFQ